MKYKSLTKLGFKESKKVKNKVLGFFNKIMICALILVVSLIILRKNPVIKDYVKEEVFNNNFSFAYFKELYQKYFGKLLPTNEDVVSVFSEKITYKKYEKYLDGYLLDVDNQYLVPVIETGIVVYIGEKEGYGKVYIVEQVDGKNVWYGNIANSSIKLYDYVVKGSFLGETKDNNLYLVIEKDGAYCDLETVLS